MKTRSDRLKFLALAILMLWQWSCSGNNTETPAPVSAPDTNMPDDIADTIKPSTPTGLKASVGRGGEIILAWNPSTDNIRMWKYIVMRQNPGEVFFRNIIGTDSLFETTFIDTGQETGLVPGTYHYYVYAVDYAGNVSDNSEIVQAATGGVVNPGIIPGDVGGGGNKNKP